MYAGGRLCLSGRTVAVTGASRGIGREIALRCARMGANVALMARSANRPSHKSLSSTLNEVADDIRRLDCEALVVPIDLARADSDSVYRAVDKIKTVFGGLDALVLNASAISIDKIPTRKTYELMMNLNVRSTHDLIVTSLPLLEKSELRHVLSMSPPLYALADRWLRPHPAYTTSKYAMTMLTLGLSDTLRCNTLWPSKLYKTAATQMLENKTNVQGYTHGLAPEIFAKAAVQVLQSKRRGESLLDSELVSVPKHGVDDIFI